MRAPPPTPICASVCFALLQVTAGVHLESHTTDPTHRDDPADVNPLLTRRMTGRCWPRPATCDPFVGRVNRTNAANVFGPPPPCRPGRQLPDTTKAAQRLRRPYARMLQPHVPRQCPRAPRFAPTHLSTPPAPPVREGADSLLKSILKSKPNRGGFVLQTREGKSLLQRNAKQRGEERWARL